MDENKAPKAKASKDKDNNTASKAEASKDGDKSTASKAKANKDGDKSTAPKAKAKSNAKATAKAVAKNKATPPDAELNTPPAKRAKLDEDKSAGTKRSAEGRRTFASRPQPKPEYGHKFWAAVKQAFETLVQSKVSSPSTLEECLGLSRVKCS